MSATPITGARVNGKLLPNNSFKKTLQDLFKRHEHEEQTDITVVLSAKQERRLKFRKFLDDQGIPWTEIGSHSYRKGSATYTASGTTDGPGIVSICLRAGWKLGGVLNTYLMLEGAGDRFCGRVCALLPQVSKEFCVLPPRFPIDMSDEETDLVEETMKAMFGKYKLFGMGFACVLRHCLASLCFHQVWLDSLPPGHPWHSTHLGMQPQVTSKLRKLVGPLEYDGQNKYCHATGIPSWSKIALQVANIEDTLKLLPERIGKLLDEKGALAGNITRTELRQAMDEVVRRTINNYHRALGLRSTPMDDSDAQIVKPQFFRWSNGTFHRLPENFILTSIGTSESSNVAKTSLAGYLRWNMPDYKNGICPIRMCEASDFAIKNQRKRFSDWSRLYKGWDNMLLQQGVQPFIGEVRRNATVEDWTARYRTAFEIHCTLVKFLHPSKTKRARMRRNACCAMTFKISTTLTDQRQIASAIKRYHVNLKRYRGLVRIQRLLKARYA